ncbi:MAG: ArdC-like ssDNA-binding domain-containing protein [Pirellulaceae bacterium]
MKHDEATKLSQQALADLNTALQHGASATLIRYLDLLARFHRYSFSNVILIASQRPEATQVAGFHTWRKLGRWVKKGEQGIAIFAPMVGRKRHDDTDNATNDDRNDKARSLFGFRVVHVFDVSQTEGDELPEFAQIHGDPGTGLQRLEHIVGDCGIQLTYDHPGSGALGVSRNGSIVICPDLPPAETFAVLVHELAHELLHQQTGRRRSVSHAVLETEAEAVAYVVCRAMGLETTARSSDYIHLHCGNTATLSQSLDYIQKTAARLIEQLHAEPAPADHLSAPSVS